MKILQFECLLILCVVISKVCCSKCSKRTTKMSSNIQERQESSVWFDHATTTFPGQRFYGPLQNRLLAKVQEGRPVTIVVIGGSNSAGGGLDSPALLYFNRVADWWKNVTSSNLTVYKISIGGTGSDFFSFCLQNILPVEQPDIVSVEMTVNDYGYKYGDAAQPMELLTRRLLLLPSRPLVMYVHFVHPSVDPDTDKITNSDCLSMQDLGFDELAEHYGIPSFSIKDSVCPMTGSRNRRKLCGTPTGLFSEDRVHVAFKSHAKMASMIINYLSKVLAVAPSKSTNKKTGQDTKTDHNLDGRPSLVKPLFSDPSISDDQLSDSMCWSYLTPNWKLPLRQTLDANVTVSHGFTYLSPKESKRLSVWHTVHRTDAYAGWLVNNEEKHHYLRIRFHIPKSATTGSAVGVILRLVKMSNTHMRTILDDEIRNSTTLFIKKCGGPQWSQTYMHPVAANIQPGFHNLTIVSDTPGSYTVSGVVIGYPGYHGYDGYRPINLRNMVWSYKQFVDNIC